MAEKRGTTPGGRQYRSTRDKQFGKSTTLYDKKGNPQFVKSSDGKKFDVRKGLVKKGPTKPTKK